MRSEFMPQIGNHCQCHAASRRRGSAYLLTLGTAMIVSVLALAALATVRVQRLHVTETQKSLQAHLNADSALEIALYRIENVSNWRSQLANSAWETSTSLGAGTFQISGVDPTDNNLLDSSYEPVQLEVTGSDDLASHRRSILLRSQFRGIRSLEAALHAGADLNFTSATATSDGILSTNANVHGSSGTMITADIESGAVVYPNGGVFLGKISTGGQWPREMPNSSDVYSYYLANGTTINANDLPLMAQNLLPNPGMESGTTGWEPNGDSNFDSKTDIVHSGTRSILVKNRDDEEDGIRAIITSNIENGVPYQLEAWIYTKSGEVDQFRIGIRTIHAGSPITTTSAWFTSQANGWIKISGNLTPSWTGALIQARLFVESNNDKKDFYIDDVLYRRNDDEANARLIEYRVISPASNPFGSNVVNSQGIYVIQCTGQRIVIRNSRIVGTLFLNSPGASSRIEGTVNWQPAVYGDNPTTPNLPALLVNSAFSINCTGANLMEPTTQVNFNPTGTPYTGTADSDIGDSYPCLIRGVVYASGALTIGSSSKFDGSVIGGAAINVSGNSLNFKYDPIYLEQNPPPGFWESPQFDITPRSITRIVD